MRKNPSNIHWENGQFVDKYGRTFNETEGSSTDNRNNLTIKTTDMSDNVTKVDPLMGFHVPVKNRGGGGGYDAVLGKNVSGGQLGRFGVLKHFRSKVKPFNRVSFRFDGDQVLMVFNVPPNTGAPFYTFGKSFNVNNTELLSNIIKTLEPKFDWSTAIYCRIEEDVKLGSLQFYKLVPVKGIV